MQFKDFLKETDRDYSVFVDKLSDICRKRDYQLKTVGKQRQHDVYLITANNKAVKTLGILAGIHGDEPAGPLGVLKYLETANPPRNIRLLIIPLLNPWGFENNSRENHDRKNINRQFYKAKLMGEAKIATDAFSGIDFFLTLHEDYRFNKFFLYYSDAYNEEKYRKLVATGKKYFPINSQRSVDGDRLKDGMIYVSRTNKKRHHIASVEYWAFRQGIHYVCTETPSKSQPLERRVDCTKALISCMVRILGAI